MGRWAEPDPARLLAALRLLALCCEPGARVADLGCLHGAYAVEFARAGYQVTGIEAREPSVVACRERGASIPGLEFVHDDVRNITAYGEFDAVFCCGLLYHLDEPCKYLAVLGEVTRRLLIVQTHYAPAPDAVNEGRAGTWYTEPALDLQYGPGALWSAWGNERSFWLAKPDLLAAIQDAGFDLVAELHDHLGDINGALDRGMFAAVKAGVPAAAGGAGRGG